MESCWNIREWVGFILLFASKKGEKKLNMCSVPPRYNDNEIAWWGGFYGDYVWGYLHDCSNFGSP